VLFVIRLFQKPQVELPRALPVVTQLDPPVEAVGTLLNTPTVVGEPGFEGADPLGQFVADLKATLQIAAGIEYVDIEISPAHQVITVAAADEPTRIRSK